MQNVRLWGRVLVLAPIAGIVACAASTGDETKEHLDEAGYAQSDDTGSTMFCGGLLGLECADGLVCVDIPDDGCDPENGGADCLGRCVPEKTIECGGLLGLGCPKNYECFDVPDDDCNPDKGGADCPGMCWPELPEDAEVWQTHEGGDGDGDGTNNLLPGCYPRRGQFFIGESGGVLMPCWGLGGANAVCCELIFALCANFTIESSCA